MAHSHPHLHEHHATGNIKIAFFLNFTFTILEMVGGVYTNSVSIIADALHDLGDTFSLGLSWYLSNVSNKAKTVNFSYGYKRFSLLGALINGVVLLTGSFFILSEAIPRIMNPEHSNAHGMIAFAIAGILFNGLAVLRVKGGKSMNEKMVAWHLFEDVLGWIAILIVSIIMLIWDVHILDPILSILITLYVLWNTLRNLKQTFQIFLQGVPESVDINKIEEELVNSISEVGAVHDTHVWSLDGKHHVLSTHLVLNEAVKAENYSMIKSKAKKIVEHYEIDHATIEIELQDENCENIY